MHIHLEIFPDIFREAHGYADSDRIFLEKYRRCIFQYIKYRKYYKKQDYEGSHIMEFTQNKHREESVIFVYLFFSFACILKHSLYTVAVYSTRMSTDTLSESSTHEGPHILSVK